MQNDNKIIKMTLFFALMGIAKLQAEELKSGLLIEPGLTYERGNTTVNYPSPLSRSTGQANGLGLSARVGFHINQALFLAFDARYARPHYHDSSVSYDAKATSMNWGPVLGMQMPNLGPRIWGGYVMGGSLDPEKSGGLNVKFKNASGYRIGAGFKVDKISLNLEYQDLIYNKTTLEQVGPFTSSRSLNNVDLKNKSWVASITFPLAI